MTNVNHHDEEAEQNCLTKRSPRWCCSAPAFFFWLCVFAFLESALATGLFSSTLSSIETRYGFTSTQSGFLGSIFDITVMVFVWAVTYFGGKGHKPRWLGIFMFITGAGAFLYCLPYFVTGSWSPQSFGAISDQCRVNGHLFEECKSSSNIYGLFLFGQIILSFGTIPLFTLGVAYIDEIAPKASASLYLGIFYAIAAVGPAVGFILGGSLLATWVEPGKKPEGIQTDDPQWVGNWWLGFLVFAILCGIFSVPLMLFPKLPSGTAELRRKEAEEKGNAIVAPLADASAEAERLSAWQTLKLVITNKTLLFNSLGGGLSGFAVFGLSVFLPKAVQTMFSLDASSASFAVGLVSIPGAAGGMFLGGAVMKCTKASDKTNARIVWIVALISTFLCFILFIGCNPTPLAGVETSYKFPAAGNGGLFSTCNIGCNCTRSTYKPVCGADGLTYFSPCFAGCTAQVNTTLTATKDSDRIFENCACVAATAPSMLASGGKCSTGCNNLGLFLGALFLLMVVTFFKHVPGLTVALHCVDHALESAAMGFNNFVFRVLGTIPGPLVFGSAVDASCALWSESCGITGSCAEYDTWKLRKYFVILAVIPIGLSTICFMLSDYFFHPHRDAYSADPSTNSNAPGSPQRIPVTPLSSSELPLTPLATAAAAE